MSAPWPRVAPIFSMAASKVLSQGSNISGVHTSWPSSKNHSSNHGDGAWCVLRPSTRRPVEGVPAAVEVEGRAVRQDGGSRHLLLPCNAWGHHFNVLLHGTPDGVPLTGVEEILHVEVRCHHRSYDARLGGCLHGCPPVRQRFCATGQRHDVLPHSYQGGKERLLVLSHGARCSGRAQDFSHFDRARRVQDELALLLLQVRKSSGGRSATAPPPPHCLRRWCPTGGPVCGADVVRSSAA